MAPRKRAASGRGPRAGAASAAALELLRSFGRGRLGFEPKFLSAIFPHDVPHQGHDDRARDVEQPAVLIGLLLAPDVEAPPRGRAAQRGVRDREPRQHQTGTLGKMGLDPYS